jgi:hypothetical protein
VSLSRFAFTLGLARISGSQLEEDMPKRKRRRVIPIDELKGHLVESATEGTELACALVAGAYIENALGTPEYRFRKSGYVLLSGADRQNHSQERENHRRNS